MSAQRYVLYYRVSTKRQGKSGLGLEAQQKDVAALVAANNGVVIAEYREIETGKNPDRPELAKAIAHARLSKAILVVAKLDRLARNVAFVATLMESIGVDEGFNFICCDCPGANRFTLHILAAVAEEEARMIGERTRKGLAVAKEKGVKLGSARVGAWTGKEHLRGFKQATVRSAVVRRRETNKKYAFLVEIVRDQRARGQTLDQVATWLNAKGHSTAQGRPWTKALVCRLLKRHAPECSGNARQQLLVPLHMHPHCTVTK